jgi:predicted Zn-ribbon and HTH transcriptional regulator
MEASCVEILNVLRNIRFPLTKEQIIEQANKHGTSYQIIEDLKNIPDRKYVSANDLIMEFCNTKFCFNT